MILNFFFEPSILGYWVQLILRSGWIPNPIQNNNKKFHVHYTKFAKACENDWVGKLLPKGGRTCHWGVVNRGCVVVGRSYPSHPFTKPHLTVYETARAAWTKIMTDENQCLQDGGVDCSSHRMRAFVWGFGFLIQMVNFHFISRLGHHKGLRVDG